MLSLDRKQMAQIGRAHMRDSLTRFLREHFPQAASMDAAGLDKEIDTVLDRCRALGLGHQSAVAAYAVACCAIGSETVERDEVLRHMLGDRRVAQDEKALLIRIWLTHAGVVLARTAR